MSSVAIVSADNYRLKTVATALEDAFDKLGYDGMNPFGHLIHPGDQVFIKPNWVASRWRESCDHVDSLYSVITHPAVIEAVADKVAVALQGKGRIIIADNPSIDANFDELMKFIRIEHLKTKYDVPCEIYDLRPLVCEDLKDYGQRDKMTSRSGDPQGSVEVNLGKKSLFYGIDPHLFRGVFNEREETVAAHTGETQLYTFSASLFNSDVFISIPKLKTHQKVGATLNMKGLVGAVTQKNQLVHWRVGYPEIGGDEYPNKQEYEMSQYAKVTHRGAWPGNDTIWRMVADLYNALHTKERRYFSIIDGIMAGEGQGPFCPTAKHANTLIVSDDFLAADIAAVRYMGYDPYKIRYLEHFIEEGSISLDEIEVLSDKQFQDFFQAKTRYLDFSVTPRWEKLKYLVE